MFICKKWNLNMYSIAKFHYTTIRMNKEGVACLKKTKLLQIGERQQVLITDISHTGKEYVAHNKSYDQVSLNTNNVQQKICGMMYKVIDLDFTLNVKRL